ncbi:MAG: hypothetical protein ACFFBP_04630 [Promethearchaeota archaeon]
MAEIKKVYIKKEAYRNMITHVLKYASKSLDYCSQVIGVCVGKPRANQNEFDVVWALPLTHGDYIDVEENKEIMNNFSTNEEQIWIKQGNTVIGWYCSHPNDGLDIVDLDIKNHQFFQKNYNSNCFVIVFDHNEMAIKDNLGFKIYYLGDQGFNEIEHDVEVPNTFDYFRWVMKFVEDSQLRTPALDFFKEIGEIKPTKTNLQEIPLAPEDLTEETVEKVYKKLEPIASGLQEGVEKFSETLLEPLLSQLDQWTKQTARGTIQGTHLLRNSINQMKEAISISMSKISKWFESNLDELVEDFNERISYNIDERVKTQIELSKLVSTVKDDTLNHLNGLIKEKINLIIKQLEIGVITLKEKSNETSTIGTSIESSIINLSEKLESLKNNANSLSGDIINDLKSFSSSIQSKLQEELDRLNSKIKSIKESSSELNNKLQKLQENLKDISES